MDEELMQICIGGIAISIFVGAIIFGFVAIVVTLDWLAEINYLDMAVWTVFLGFFFATFITMSYGVGRILWPSSKKG